MPDTIPKNPNFLQKQLERARFERALEVADSMVQSGAFLNSGELARLNQILNGNPPGEPWNDIAQVRTLPSGVKQTFGVLADPVNTARDILQKAKARADAGDVIEAAGDLYAQLVLNHVFKDANRRTAVVAVSYLLRLHGVFISAMGLHELGIGDLRGEGQLDVLKDLLRQVVRVSQRQGG